MLRKYCEQLYANKLDKLKSKDKFLEPQTYKKWIMKNKKCEQMNKKKEIIKLPTKEKTRTRWFHWWILTNP